MEAAIIVEYVDGVEVYVIYKIKRNAKYYLTPGLRFERHYQSRGHITKWEKAKIILLKILNEEII